MPRAHSSTWQSGTRLKGRTRKHRLLSVLASIASVKVLEAGSFGRISALLHDLFGDRVPVAVVPAIVERRRVLETRRKAQAPSPGFFFRVELRMPPIAWIAVLVAAQIGIICKTGVHNVLILGDC